MTVARLSRKHRNTFIGINRLYNIFALRISPRINCIKLSQTHAVVYTTGILNDQTNSGITVSNNLYA